MPLTRCSAQKSQSLEETYSELAQSDIVVSSILGNSMLNVIEFIEATFHQTEIFGLTSVHHLVLLSEDNWQSEWYVKIIITGWNEYHIEYKMTKDIQPWENAIVKGQTQSFEQFKDFIIIAMFETQGWQKSEELQNLYRQIKR